MLLEELASEKPVGVEWYENLFTHVTERADSSHNGPNRLDVGKNKTKLGWRLAETFEARPWKSVESDLGNQKWGRQAQDGKSQRERMGLAAEAGE